MRRVRAKITHIHCEDSPLVCSCGTRAQIPFFSLNDFSRPVFQVPSLQLPYFGDDDPTQHSNGCNIRASCRAVQIPSFASHPDHDFVVVSARASPYTLLVVDATERQIVGTCAVPQRPTWGLDCIVSSSSSPPSLAESSLLVVGGYGSKIRVLDARDLSVRFEVHRPPDDANIVKHAKEWLPKVCVGGWAGGVGGVVRIYDLSRGSQLSSLLGEMRGPRSGVKGLALSVTRDSVFTAHRDGYARCWDPKTNTKVTEVSLEGPGLSCLFVEESACLFVGKRHGMEAWDCRFTQSRLWKVGEECGTNYEEIVRAGAHQYIAATSEGLVCWKGVKCFDEVARTTYGSPQRDKMTGVCLLQQSSDLVYQLTLENERVLYLFGNCPCSLRLVFANSVELELPTLGIVMIGEMKCGIA